MPAPIALFAFNRPKHTRRALESLSANSLAAKSELFVFCDGARRADEQVVVDQVREIAETTQWCGRVQVVSHSCNLGCAQSVIQGVSKLCAEYGKVIVLEDDLVLSPFFLDYMNEAVLRYESDEQVVQVSGYMFPISTKVNQGAGFLPFISSWGWATWQRAWRYFDSNMGNYPILAADPALQYRFDLEGNYPYFDMLQSQRKGKLDSWAIRWYLSTFSRNGLTLYPAQSLVSNTGFDLSGTHCGLSSDFNAPLATNRVQSFPPVALDVTLQTAVYSYLSLTHGRKSASWKNRMHRWGQSLSPWIRKDSS